MAVVVEVQLSYFLIVHYGEGHLLTLYDDV